MKIVTDYCPTCKGATRHKVLKQTSFLTQFAISVLTKFMVDHREPTHKCLRCGNKHTPA